MRKRFSEHLLPDTDGTQKGSKLVVAALVQVHIVSCCEVSGYLTTKDAGEGDDFKVGNPQTLVFDQELVQRQCVSYGVVEGRGEEECMVRIVTAGV